MRQFYGNLLGLEEIGSFNDHAGFDGVMFGCPGREFHLEFTRADTSEVPVWSAETLLVLYVPDRAGFDEIVTRLTAANVPSVESDNPYWQSNGKTFLDPDGRRVVLSTLPGLAAVAQVE